MVPGIMQALRFSFFLLILGLPSVGVSQNLFGIPSAELYPECGEKFYNTFGCLRAIEAGELRAKKMIRVVRNLEILNVQCAKDKVALKDKGGDDAATVTYYNYLTFSKALNAHILYVNYYEGGTFMLIPYRSCKPVYPSGYPIPSDDGVRFFNVSMDLMAGYYPNNVEIWRIKRNGNFQREANFEPEWGPGNGRWINNTHIQINKSCLTERNEIESCGTTNVKLISDKWVLE